MASITTEGKSSKYKLAESVGTVGPNPSLVRGPNPEFLM